MNLKPWIGKIEEVGVADPQLPQLRGDSVPIRSIMKRADDVRF